MSGKTTYVVLVWVDNVEVRDEGRQPEVKGTIDLTPEEFSALDSKLYGLMGEDFIVEYQLEQMETPEPVTPDGILSAVIGVFEDSESDAIRSIWESRS